MGAFQQHLRRKGDEATDRKANGFWVPIRGERHSLWSRAQDSRTGKGRQIARRLIPHSKLCVMPPAARIIGGRKTLPGLWFAKLLIAMCSPSFCSTRLRLI
jgi:hypothetical protein